MAGPEPEDGAGARILIVEDLPAVRLTLRTILARAGYRCREAGDVPAALAELAREPADLVLCDLHLPGASGLELMKAIRPGIPDTAVLVVSGVEDADTALECLHLGAFGYVLKPFQAREILVQVASALRRRMLEISYRDRELHLARVVREQTREIREGREELAFRLLAASGQRDRETGAHLRRIGLCAAELGRLLGWEDGAVDTLQSAAPLHDIGKIGVPDAILQKPGALTEPEWVVMRSHTTMGAAILEGSTVPFIQMGARIAVAHHERWDGRGYPDGLQGERIPLPARILAVADVFDALHAERPYKAGMEIGRVREILEEGKGTHFDPDCVEAFLRVLERRHPQATRRRSHRAKVLQSVDA